MEGDPNALRLKALGSSSIVGTLFRIQIFRLIWILDILI